jgi:hypothetical protein
LITSKSHLSSIYSRYRGVPHSLCRAHGCPASFTFHTTFTNLGKTYYTCIAPHFLVCIPISFLFVYRSGAFGWIDAYQVSKKNYLSFIQRRRRPRRCARWTSYSCVLSFPRFTYRTVSVFLYLLLVWSIVNRALFLALYGIHAFSVIVDG